MEKKSVPAQFQAELFPFNFLFCQTSSEALMYKRQNWAIDSGARKRHLEPFPRAELEFIPC